MNTNNAPERPVGIQQALNSIRAVLNAVKHAPTHLETVLGYIEGLECQLNHAMQPQVSEGDELVECLCLIADGEGEAQVLAQQTLNNLARHRQPAAVSADAVEVYDRLNELEKCGNILQRKSREQQLAILQAYGDQHELNGARKMQEAAAKFLTDHIISYSAEGRELRPNKHSSIENEPWANAIHALSPETVCKGE